MLLFEGCRMLQNQPWCGFIVLSACACHPVSAPRYKRSHNLLEKGTKEFQSYCTPYGEMVSVDTASQGALYSNWYSRTTAPIMHPQSSSSHYRIPDLAFPFASQLQLFPDLQVWPVIHCASAQVDRLSGKKAGLLFGLLLLASSAAVVMTPCRSATFVMVNL